MEPVVTGCLRTPHTTLPTPPPPLRGRCKIKRGTSDNKTLDAFVPVRNRRAFERERADCKAPSAAAHIASRPARRTAHHYERVAHTWQPHTADIPQTSGGASLVYAGGGGRGGGGGIPTPTLAGERGNRRAPEIPWPAAKRPTTLRLDCIPLHPKGLTCTYL